MTINIGHIEEPADQEVAEKFLSKHREKQIRNEITAILDDEYSYFEEYASSYITERAKYRAEMFLEAVLDGDSNAEEALFQTGFGSRYKKIGYDAGKPWAHLIHGRIFQTSQMELRDRLVNDYAELLKNERIKDLESIVEGLKQQVNELELANHKLGEKLSNGY